MEFNQLKELIELFSNSKLDQLDLDQEGLTLKLVKKRVKTVVATSLEPATAIAATAHPTETHDEEADDSSLLRVTSPIVGTYYRAANPNADPFVKVGDSVRKGQTLCIVEAMKLMNEIQADHDGVIVKVYVDNGEGVEFGQSLYALKPL